MQKTANKDIAYVTGTDVEKLRPALTAMLEEAAQGNPFAAEELNPQELVDLAAIGMAVFFVAGEGDEIETILAIRFSDISGKKCAEILALAGKHLLLFKALYWDTIIQWLEQNDVDFLDACVPSERASIYMNKFGFDTQAAVIRRHLEKSK